VTATVFLSTVRLKLSRTRARVRVPACRTACTGGPLRLHPIVDHVLLRVRAGPIVSHVLSESCDPLPVPWKSTSQRCAAQDARPAPLPGRMRVRLRGPPCQPSPGRRRLPARVFPPLRALACQPAAQHSACWRVRVACIPAARTRTRTWPRRRAPAAQPTLQGAPRRDGRDAPWRAVLGTAHASESARAAGAATPESLFPPIARASPSRPWPTASSSGTRIAPAPATSSGSPVRTRPPSRHSPGRRRCTPAPQRRRSESPLH
jgi:hypothetical protein